MKILEAYTPVLVGSVWRGTAHHESDIDIVLYYDDPNKVLETIRQNDLKITQAEWTPITERGIKKTSFHIHIELPTNEQAELIVRSPEEANRRQRCEIYGDLITGLHTRELEKMLEENPSQKFVPH
jgi:predicted nucleotidyltransferase